MKKKKKIKWKTLIPIYAMMLPGLIYLLINNYAPMFGLVIAFKRIDWGKGILKSDWVGFSNFTYLFSSDEAWTMTRNTIGYNILFIVIGTVVAIMVAIFMNEITSKFANRIYQTLILLPYMISWVVCGYLVNALLSSETGLINLGILSKLGIEPIVWYQEKKYWPYITLPLLKPTIITLLIMNIGSIFYSDFGLFYQIPRNSGALYDVTQTIDTYVYNALMQQGNIALSAAAGFYQSIVGFVLVVIANAVVRKYSKESALF